MKKPFATLLIRVKVGSKEEAKNIILSMCRHDVCEKFDFLCYNDNEVIFKGECKCVNKEDNKYECKCLEENMD